MAIHFDTDGIKSNDSKTQSAVLATTLQNPVSRPAVLIKFLPRIIRDWNDLPQEVTEAKTIDTIVSRASRLQ